MADITSTIAIRVLDAFTGPLRQFQDGLRGIEARSRDVEAVGKRLKASMAFAADLNQAAEAMGRFSSYVTGPMSGAVEEFRSFEKAMSNVAALSDQMKGSAGYEVLKQQALDLGAATAFSAQQVAEAQGIYAQAGRTVEQIIAMTPVTLAAAQANTMSIADTAAIVGHTMTQMGMQASDAGRAVDVLTASAAASDMTLRDMGTALAYVGPVAHQAGMSLELTSAFLGKLKDAGLEASSTGVGMRAVLTRLLDPSREASRALGQLGFTTRQVRDLQRAVASGHPEQALARIGAAAEKLPNERRMKLMSQIFGMEAQTAASVAIQASMDTSTEGVTAKADALLKHAAGTNERMANIMTDNLDGAMERASGAVSGLKTSVGEVLAPTVHAGASAVEGLAGAMQKFVTTNPRFSKATLEVVAGLGGISAGLSGVLTTMSAFTSASAYAQKAFATLSGSMLGRFGLVGAAAAAGVALGTWAENAFNLSDKISKLLGRGSGADSPATAGTRGGGEGALSDPQAQHMAGGWILHSGTGHVIRRGRTDAMPDSVRRAVKMGASRTSVYELNAMIDKQRRQAAAPRIPANYAGMFPEDSYESMMRRLRTPRMQRMAEENILSPTVGTVNSRTVDESLGLFTTGPQGTLPAAPTDYTAPPPQLGKNAIVEATKDQTQTLVKALKENEDAMRDVAAILRDRGPMPRNMLERYR